MKSPYGKVATISASALLAITLSAAVAPAANASVPTIQPMVSMISAPAAIPSDSYTAQVLTLINNERAKVGAKPLAWNQAISKVSQDWAAHLGVATKSDSFDWATIHRSDAGGSLIPAGALGYAEIIAFNSTPESIVQWWMNSPSHKAAMLNPKHTDIGIGYVVPTSGPYTGWHQVVANLAVYPTATTGPTAPGSIVPAGTQYKTTIQLNLRSGPGTTYGIIGSGVTGTIVTATGKTSDIWYEVKMGSQTGWMSSDYLTKYADAAATKSAIAVKAASLNGSLGYATGNEIYGLKNGGGYQMYQGGAIIYSPASGARVSSGAIRTTWASTGFENGFLGYPVADEVGGLKNGGAYQTYQGGSIVWSPNTGAQVSVGGIRTVWAASGYENGPLGYPTSNEVGGLKDGGVYQMYEGGAIIWSPASGGYISMGGIRTMWASTGFESGRLGYPTSNEYVTGPGGQVAQNYQGGTIKWSPSGSSIVYK